MNAEANEHGRLEGRVAIITGGSRGLGRHIAGAYAEQGATVVIASRKLEACQQAAEDIHRETGREAHAQACHVGRWADCDALVAHVLDRYGRIDVLVNNAGLSPLYPSLPEVTEELYDKVLSVNLKGAFRLTALTGAAMAERDGGSIINISSIAAIRPTPVELPYAAAKAGMNALTAGFARAFGPTVRVNTIMPGMFATDIAKAWDEQEVAEMVRDTIPAGRVGQPREIVGAALYLASDDASYTTGAEIKVDGGTAY